MQPTNKSYDLIILRFRNIGEIAFFNQDLSVITQKYLTF